MIYYQNESFSEPTEQEAPLEVLSNMSFVSDQLTSQTKTNSVSVGPSEDKLCVFKGWSQHFKLY